jgi:hypothetical protein
VKAFDRDSSRHTKSNGGPFVESYGALRPQVEDNYAKTYSVTADSSLSDMKPAGSLKNGQAQAGAGKRIRP